MEVVERGYGGQGNEFSYQMLLVSNYMLNHVFEPYSVFSNTLTASGHKFNFRILRFQLRACISPNFVY